MMKIFSLIIILSFISISRSLNLSNEDKIEIFLNFFGVGRTENVPDYHVLDIKSENFPGGKHMSMQIFGKDFMFKLKRVPEELHARFPVYEMRKNSLHPKGFSLELLDNEDSGHDYDAYQDEENHAAFLIHPDEDGIFSVEGMIGDDHVIQPIPPHLLQQFVKSDIRKKRSNEDSRPNDEMFLDQIGQDLQDDENIATGKKIFEPDVFHRHLIYRLPSNGNDNHKSDYVFMETEDNEEEEEEEEKEEGEEGNRKRRSLRSKRQTPSTVYIDTLVYVDHLTYKRFGNDAKKIRRYQNSFWNAVDLRFRTLKSPKVRINLVGVVVAKTADGVPFVADHLTKNNMLVADYALDDMGKFLYLMKNQIKTKYDIALTVTSIDICSLDSQRRCGRSTTGLAYVAGACVVNRRSEKMVNAGIVEDTGGYSGVMTAAHEVGHLLGAVHDGEPPPRYEELPGAESCSFQEGYIMSYLHTKNSFKWSPCSINIFQKFLRGEGASCVYNTPRKIRKLTTPGKLMSLDDQCRMDRGTKACFKDYRVCTQLFCYNQGSSGSCTAYRPAIDGSSCGIGLYCMDGKCLKRKK